ncbi:MAG: HAD family hydrolase [Phycisphaerae bacterium]|nr:HAD family hydrolase [Phycisphaerae bacterium]
MRKPPAVIFDLDGTLVDTLDDITASLNAAVAGVGTPPYESPHVRRMVGEGLPALMQRATGLTEEQQLHRLIEAFRQHYLTHLLDRSRLYPGMAETLDRLANAGCPLAVLSNKPHDATQQICAALLNAWPFVSVLGADAGHPKKPDPQGALWLANRLDRAPSDVYFVGDSGIDMQTATAAGMIPLGVTWGFRDVEELRLTGARALADRPEQIAPIILDA